MLTCWAGPGLTCLLLLRDSCCMAELHFKLCGGDTTIGDAGAMGEDGAAVSREGLCGILDSLSQDKTDVPA